jgi:hypothetical protein
MEGDRHTPLETNRSQLRTYIVTARASFAAQFEAEAVFF